MDDQRFSSSMRRIADPAEPRPEFLTALHDELAAELGFSQPGLNRPSRQAKPRLPARTGRWSAARVAGIAALVSVLLLLGAAVLYVGTRPVQPPPTPTPTPTDLLSKVRAAGALTIAVRPDFPQVTTNGADKGGFDEDVARELARRLQVLDVIRPVPESGMLVPPGIDGWDVAMPSRALTPTELSSEQTTTPYYYWPVYVVVSTGSVIAAPAGLGDQSVCVAEGSSAQLWLAGNLAVETSGPVGSPPPGISLVVTASDGECLTSLAAGSVAAMVTSTSTAADLTTNASVRRLDSPAFTEVRRIVVTGIGDGTTLRAAIDVALDGMRADGTLADLSRRRFGSEDLSVIPHP